MFTLKFVLAALLLVSAVATGCPDLCDCYSSPIGPLWNCTGISSADQLISPSTDGESPKGLIISDSKIDYQTTLTKYFPAVEIVEITNSLIDCTRNLSWLLKWSSILRDTENLLCTSPQTLNGTNVFKALHLIEDVNSQCPKRCECVLSHVPKDDQYVTVTVSCNNLGLTELPEILPANVTIHLDLSNNRIENIGSLTTNQYYRRVTVVYLNNNHIRSIPSLENSEWIEQVSLLSLQRNHLHELPIQTLTTALKYQDVNGFRLFLSNNPWKCDCATVTQFQSMIAQHKQLIKDVANVTCGPNEGTNAGLKISTIEIASVCEIHGYNSINLMDILNAMLALLTILTVGKLLYDYYAYRKTGQLPWLASKLP